ncbi:MAG: hypothetical protein IPM57_07495 [Oligoflexia bacterium]|nr:hypothetical protein [Oligoflexia bacterium]
MFKFVFVGLCLFSFSSFGADKTNYYEQMEKEFYRLESLTAKSTFSPDDFKRSNFKSCKMSFKSSPRHLTEATIDLLSYAPESQNIFKNKLQLPVVQQAHLTKYYDNESYKERYVRTSIFSVQNNAAVLIAGRGWQDNTILQHVFRKDPNTGALIAKTSQMYFFNKFENDHSYTVCIK